MPNGTAQGRCRGRPRRPPRAATAGRRARSATTMPSDDAERVGADRERAEVPDPLRRAGEDAGSPRHADGSSGVGAATNAVGEPRRERRRQSAASARTAVALRVRQARARRPIRRSRRPRTPRPRRPARRSRRRGRRRPVGPARADARDELPGAVADLRAHRSRPSSRRRRRSRGRPGRCSAAARRWSDGATRKTRSRSCASPRPATRRPRPG